MKQGKCVNCEILYRWEKELHGKYCHCPKCGKLLQRTTYYLKKYPLVEPVVFDNKLVLPNTSKEI